MRATGTTPNGTVSRALRPTAKALPEHARAHNRSLVLGYLFHVGPSSRADIARSTGLTRVTVSGLVGDLINEGLVEELGVRAEGKVGKPATLVGMRTESFQIVTVDLAPEDRMRGAVLTLVGDIVARRDVERAGAVGDAAVEQLEQLCRDLLAAADRPVIGIGIASPGVIDQSGRVIAAPNYEWVERPLASDLTRRLGVPVQIANDANTRALGEFTYGAASGSGTLVITTGQGVGAGVVVDGALLAGRHNAAGEIGHVTVVDDDTLGEVPLPCACGRKGCLETVMSVPALRRRIDGLTPEDADAALASVGRLFGTGLAPVVSTLDLDEVLLSGPPELLDGAFIEAAISTVRARTMPVAGHELSVRMGSLDEDGVLAGAAVLVLSAQLGVT